MIWANLYRDQQENKKMILRAIAGIFAGTGALVLIYKGHITEGSIILTSLIAFFVGEANGKKTARSSD